MKLLRIPVSNRLYVPVEASRDVSASKSVADKKSYHAINSAADRLGGSKDFLHGTGKVPKNKIYT